MEIKRVPIRELKQEEGAKELVKSEGMELYLKLALAQLRQSGIEEAMHEIEALPLEKRYVWRIVSALKWAFADCDGESAQADKLTMSAEDLSKVKELLSLRPAQFCIIMKALFGEQEMVRMMASGIAMARQAIE